MPADLGYIILVFALFVMPQVLARLGIPTAITSLGMGAICSLGFGLFHGEPTIDLLAVFGIVALFLFAGLEVDFGELRARSAVLLQHVALRALAIGGVAYLLQQILGIEARAAIIVALALLTPSTGFILSSLDAFGLSGEDRIMVKSKAIAAELLALGVLFLCTQSETWGRLALSGAALAGVVMVLPIALWGFARFLMPHAPRSEFAFLLVLAVSCAYLTKQLGAYYLLGAFLAGVIAQRTRAYVPEMLSPRIIDAIELFASFFIPFYFFHAGLELSAGDFSREGLAAGVILVIVVLPLRVAAMLVHRRLGQGHTFRQSLRLATALLPTLVFTLVLSHLLRDQYNLPGWLIGALVIYTLASTIIPGFVLRMPHQPDFTAPEAAAAPVPAEPAVVRRAFGAGRRGGM